MAGGNVMRCLMCDAPTRAGRDFTFNVVKMWRIHEETFRVCQIDAWAMEHEEGFAKKVGDKIQKALA